MLETPDDMSFIHPSNKEFVNLQGYYLILKHTNKDIIIIIYNIDELDGIRYELKMSLDDIYNLNNIFRVFKSIKEIYDAIIKLIADNN